MMNDLEICKRIAEIEGYVFCDGGKYARCELTKHGKVVGYLDYNPLTDDALNHQLMIKYRVSVDFLRPSDVWIGNDINITFRGNPNKAILLAIIEAHNE